ncbi:MAG TPA: phosphoribosylglycinamide formyltransferase [Acidimicrobiia bacterium]
MLASGSGTNFQALVDDGLPGLVVLISDVEDCRALERARRAAIATRVVRFDGDRARFTREICDAAEGAGAKALVLAGFMRVLGREAIERFPNRIVKIHPSLLPAFPGKDAVVQALAAGVRVTGVTVHFVDELVDHGPIIAQQAVEVQPDDDLNSLHARLQAVEHSLYPQVVRALAEGRLDVREGRVVWS